jgi:hypothetical protein
MLQVTSGKIDVREGILIKYMFCHNYNNNNNNNINYLPLVCEPVPKRSSRFLDPI